MTNNSNRLISRTILFIGMVLLLPFFGFSQQEEPRRVSMIINLKEIIAEKEIIQLPATNLPIMAKVSHYKPHSKAIPLPARKNNRSSRSVIKENLALKKPNIAVAKIKPTAKEPNIIAKPTHIPPKRPETTVSTVTTSIVAQKNNAQKGMAPNVKPNSTSTETNTSAKKTGEETTASLKLKTDTIDDILKVSHGAKVNSFSYIWIGIFLIAAGIVLGLLFGKPAFLVSFVGVVFIILGLIIQSK